MTFLIWYLIIGMFITALLQWILATRLHPFWKPTVQGFIVCTFMWPLVVGSFIWNFLNE